MIAPPTAIYTHTPRFNDYNSVVNVEYLDPLGSSDHIVIRFEYRCYFEYEKHNFERLNYYKGDYESMRKEIR